MTDDKENVIHERSCWDKVLTPHEAARKCYGMGRSPGMVFIPLGTTLAGARKLISQYSKRLQANEVFWPKWQDYSLREIEDPKFGRIVNSVR